MSRPLNALLFALIFVSSASAQVRVDIRPTKDVYLAGEPIFFEVKVTNIGEEPLAYGGSDRLDFDIAGRTRYAWREACGWSSTTAVAGGGSSHPPTFDPGKSVSFQHVLRGYRLEPGRYQVTVAGSAPVWWRRPEWMPPPAVPVIRSEPVPGVAINSTIQVVVIPTDAAALRRVFDDLARRIRGFSISEAQRIGFYENAPASFIDRIAEWAPHLNWGGRAAYEALADFNTVESRAHLRRLFDQSRNLDERAVIVDVLHRTAHADNVDFLTSLLPGRRTEADRRIKDRAVSALRCIGGADVQRKLMAGVRTWNASDAIPVLAKTGLREAVSEIINFPIQDDFDAVSSACGAVYTLTHHRCETPLAFWERLLVAPEDAALKRVEARRQHAQMRRWWSRNRDRIRISGPHQEWQGPGNPPIIR